MRRLLLLLIVPLLVLFRLDWPNEKPDLAWLYGGWHDPDHESTRMVWTRTGENQALGLFTSESHSAVLSIDSGGQLTVCNLSKRLEQNTPPALFPLRERSPRGLEYQHFALHYLNSRSDSDELEVTWLGNPMRLRRD